MAEYSTHKQTGLHQLWLGTHYLVYTSPVSQSTDLKENLVQVAFVMLYEVMVIWKAIKHYHTVLWEKLSSSSNKLLQELLQTTCHLPGIPVSSEDTTKLLLWPNERTQTEKKKKKDDSLSNCSFSTLQNTLPIKHRHRTWSTEKCKESFTMLLPSQASNHNPCHKRDAKQKAATQPFRQTALKIPGWKTMWVHDLHTLHRDRK